MAYKFQLGPAVMSGTLEQEGSIDITDSGVLQIAGSTLADASRNLTAAQVSGSGNLLIGGTVKLDGVADAAADVAADSFYFLDGDGLMKREAMADYAASIAGNGLAVSSGVLAVGVDDTGIEINSDALRLKDSGVVTAKIADDAVTPAKMSLFDDSLAATDTHILIADGTDYSSFAMSGDATLSNAGVLTIAADAVHGTMLNTDAADGTTMELSSDSLSVLKVPNALSQGDGIAAFSYDGSGALTVALSASVGGAGLAYASGVLSLDIDELTAGSSLHQTEDHFAFSDNGTEKKISFSDLEDAIFANVSGDATVAAGGALTIADSAVETAMIADDAVTSAKIATGAVVADGIAADAVEAGALNDDVISGQTELAQGDMAVADEIMISDGGLLKKIGVNNFFRDGGKMVPEAAIAVADDYLLFLDGGDGGDQSKESVADFVAAIAGSGIDASNGVLSVGGSQVSGSGDVNVNLIEGFNFQNTTLSADRTWTLPATGNVDAGSVVRVKAGNLAGNKITVARNGATIDGQSVDLELEANGAAVSLMYVGGGAWQLF